MTWAPRAEAPREPLDWRQGLIGFPVDPGADPLGAGIGPASWQRGKADEPDLNVEGDPKLVPLGKEADYHVAHGDADLRGWPAVASDGETVGRVVDLWFNRAEFFLRYLEVDIGEERTRIAPLFMMNLDTQREVVRAYSLTSADFRRAPVTTSPDHITQREEDRIAAYFAGGLRYSSGIQGVPRRHPAPAAS